MSISNLQKDNMGKMIMWVPENLDIDRVTLENQKEYIQGRLKKENLLYICDALIKSRANNRQEMTDSGTQFAPLSSSLLDLVIHDYKKYLDFLIGAGILLTDYTFKVGEKCRGYCFAYPYSGQRLKMVLVESYLLKKGIRRFKDNWQQKLKKDTWGYSYLTKWWDTGGLQIDVKGAFDWIDRYEKGRISEIGENASSDKTANIIDTCEDFKMQVRRINEGGHKYGFSGDGHRFYNPISNLKRELRSFLTYEGRELVSIDIKNSQPFFSIALHDIKFWEGLWAKNGKKGYIKDIIKDKEIGDNIITLLKSFETQSYQGIQYRKFIELVVKGNFYEYMTANFRLLFKERFDTRDKVKKEVLRILFSDPRKDGIRFYEPCRWFEQHFPVSYELFKKLKSKDYTMLPILLQRVESHLVIDIICKQITQKDALIPVFTIHDSIITTVENKAIVEAIMMEEIEAEIGHRPKLAIEELFPIIWKPVVGWEGFYEISNRGEVRGVARMVVAPKGLRTIKGRKIKTRINNDGYVEIRLSKEGKTKTTFLHILLASAFIINPDKKPEVNHINGIKTDNRIMNLEWVTHSENMQHAFKNNLVDRSKNSVTVVDGCTGIQFRSIREAASYQGVNYNSLRNMLSGNNHNSTCLEIIKLNRTSLN